MLVAWKHSPVTLPITQSRLLCCSGRQLDIDTLPSTTPTQATQHTDPSGHGRHRHAADIHACQHVRNHTGSETNHNDNRNNHRYGSGAVKTGTAVPPPPTPTTTTNTTPPDVTTTTIPTTHTSQCTQSSLTKAAPIAPATTKALVEIMPNQGGTPACSTMPAPRNTTASWCVGLASSRTHAHMFALLMPP